MPRSREENKKIKDERRDELVSVAFKLLAQKGLSRLTLNELGKAAGVSHGLVYHYFSSKEELFETLASRAKGFNHIEWNRIKMVGSLDGIALFTSFFGNTSLSKDEISFALYEMSELRHEERKKASKYFQYDPKTLFADLLEQAAAEQIIPYGDYDEKAVAVFDFLRGYLIRLGRMGKEEKKKAAFNKTAINRMLSY